MKIILKKDGLIAANFYIILTLLWLRFLQISKFATLDLCRFILDWSVWTLIMMVPLSKTLSMIFWSKLAFGKSNINFVLIWLSLNNLTYSWRFLSLLNIPYSLIKSLMTVKIFFYDRAHFILFFFQYFCSRAIWQSCGMCLFILGVNLLKI